MTLPQHDGATKKTCIISGPVLSQSGYGVHSRQVARWALARPNVDVRFHVTPWGDTPFLLNDSACGGLVGEIMKRTSTPVPGEEKADVSIQVKLPNEWSRDIAHKNVGVSAVVETDRCLPAWVDACNAMDRVIVPSQHAKACLTNSGKVTVPLTVVPESYSDAIASLAPPASLPRFSTPFNFLVFGQLTGNNASNDRKNTFFAIKWLCEAFKDDPNVGIILKTNAGRSSKIDRQITANIIKQLLDEVRQGPNPRVHFLHGDMSDEEVAALYKHDQVKALVALTRGEGFGLPILEAAASGLPVIATGWSGHLDFMKLGKFISVFYQLTDVHPSRVDDRIFVKGARWAEASEADAKARLTKFRNAPAIPQEWARELRARVIPAYSFREISDHYDAAIGDLL